MESAGTRLFRDESDDAGGGEAGWIEAAARAGYAAKGVVYATMGALAILGSLGREGDATGTREALRHIASAPLGTVLAGILAGGLAGYVVWRMVQAFYGPEAREDGGWKRTAVRVYYLGSGLIYAVLAYEASLLILRVGGGGGGGSEMARGVVVSMMGTTWGVAVLGAVGVAIAGRGGLQFVKAYTANFEDRLRSFEIGPVRSEWVVAVSRVGLTARGVIFALFGGVLVHGAFTHDPSQTGGQEVALEFVSGQPWLLAPIGVGLVCYALYQWTKARYRLIGVDD